MLLYNNEECRFSFKCTFWSIAKRDIGKMRAKEVTRICAELLPDFNGEKEELREL